MEQTFTGKLTEIRTPRTGTSKKGEEWANAEFEVTELNPQNPEYPQVAFFDFFKMGEYLSMAKDFESKFKLGDVVTVHFNFKANTYVNKDQKEVKFYKTSAWRIDKSDVQQGADMVDASFAPATEIDDDLGF